MKKIIPIFLVLFFVQTSMAAYIAIIFPKGSYKYLMKEDNIPNEVFELPEMKLHGFRSGATNLFAYDESGNLLIRGSLTDHVDTSDWEVVNNLPPSGIKELYPGKMHTLLIDNNNKLWGAGSNSYGQLGLVSTEETVESFTQAIFPINNENITDLALGDIHSLALDSTGKLWVAGRGTYGMLGLNNTSDSSNFVEVVDGPIAAETIVHVEAGKYSSYALDDNGGLWVTGRNAWGDLGLGHNNQVDIWTKVTNGSISSETIIRVEAGVDESAYAIDSNGKLWVVGNNDWGSLGVGGMDEKNSWVKTSGLIGNEVIVDIAAGRDYAIALTNNGKAWFTGLCQNLGSCFGTNNRDYDEWTEIEIDLFSKKIVNVEAGTRYIMLVDEDDNAFAIGENLGLKGADWEKIAYYDKTSDIDGDGTTDFVEVKFGTNPQDENNFPHLLSHNTSGSTTHRVDIEYFYTDDNGLLESYSNDVSSSITFTPKIDGESVSISFIDYQTERDYDSLFIYDGLTDASNLIMECNDSNCKGMTYTATNPDGALTLKFESDDIVNEAGWVAKIKSSLQE